MVNTFVPNTTILSSAVNQNNTDFASGLSNCLTKDGQQVNTANQNFAGFKITSLGSGTGRTDSVNLGQVEDGVVNWVVCGGTASAISATYSPALTALVDGQLCFFRASASNNITNPTFAPNALTAHTITRGGGSALAIGDIAGNLAEVVLRYNLANTRWELLNPYTVTALPASTIDGLTAKATPAAADEVVIWDAAGSATKKATLSSLGNANTAPTVQRFTSGTSLTYTPTAGFVRIRVRMVGGGGGGSAASANNGSAGNDTSFGSWVAKGGGLGTFSGAGGAGGSGGANGTGTLVTRAAGGAGGGGGGEAGQSGWAGAAGGASAFGGNGSGGLGTNASATAGQAGATNTGGGGGGGGGNGTSSGSGGGAGEYVEFWMTAAQVGASQTYTVGAAANGGSAGGQAGGNGAAGVIIVEEYYI